MDKHRRVFLADSDGDFVGELAALAEKAGFWVVGTAQNGEEALGKLRECPTDFLVLDLMLPKQDGLGVMKALENPPATLATTAFYSAYVGKALEQLGVKYLVQKPCDLSSIVEHLYALSAYSRWVEETEVSRQLQKMGVPVHVKGYAYLREAALLVRDNGDLLQAVTKELYPLVAKKFDSSVSRVERSIRHGIFLARERGGMGEFQGRPTNSEVIEELVRRLDRKVINL